MTGAESDERVIVWFDIDNTLYSASSNISHAMGERIHAFFVSLGLGHEEASKLHLKYYSEYGLALRGLTRHHNIDPIEFDRQCDGSLPLEDMIAYQPSVRQLFQDIDRTKARVWALTNAYRPHAQRVLRILQLEDQIEGLVYCDYEDANFVCKPEAAYYHMALKQANLSDPSKCYFVDDSLSNIAGARAVGWAKCVHFCEQGLETTEGGRKKEIEKSGDVSQRLTGVDTVAKLEELRLVWPEIFKR